jgi:hypothetical protein
MDTDDFDIEVVSTIGGSLKGSKGGTGTDVIIYGEQTETQVPSEDPQGEPTTETTTTWFVIVNTANELRPGGSLKVIATAYVPDAHADDGIRKQIATAVLDKFIEP